MGEYLPSHGRIEQEQDPENPEDWLPITAAADGTYTAFLKIREIQGDSDLEEIDVAKAFIDYNGCDIVSEQLDEAGHG